ncbi:MAG TPA: cell surface protein [Porphyromonadaceae bacterium]|nr:cell surface protein [Porphyromonadaceae bacterium]
MVSFTASGASYDFESGGLRFKILSGTDRTVSVVGIAGKANPPKEMVIPSKVIYDSKTYDVTAIGDSAFQDFYDLTSVTIPNSVTAIGASAFESCYSLTSVTIPNSVTTIGESAFYGCSDLTSVTIPNSVTTIGAFAFSECHSLTSITIPNSVTTIGALAFCYCDSLTSVTISNSVTTIEEATFSNCDHLTSVTIPNSVTTIGDSAFLACYHLTSVTIPASVTYLGEKAFYDCGLECIYMQVKEPLSCTKVVSDKDLELCTLYVPAGTLEAYKKVDPWRNFCNIEEMEYSGISDVGTDNEEVLQFSVNDGVLTIIGIGEDQAIDIYDMHGREVYRGVSRTIENLAHGIYIVKFGNKAMKVKI